MVGYKPLHKAWERGLHERLYIFRRIEPHGNGMRPVGRRMDLPITADVQAVQRFEYLIAGPHSHAGYVKLSGGGKDRLPSRPESSRLIKRSFELLQVHL